MNKFYYFIFVLSSLLLTIGCDCDKTTTCPGFTENAIIAMPSQEGNVVFTNGNDSTISFELNAEQIYHPNPPERDCRDSGPFGRCDCSVCPAAYYSRSMQLPIPISKTDSIFLKYPKGTYLDGSYIRSDTSFYRTDTFKTDNYSISILDLNPSKSLTYRFLGINRTIRVFVEPNLRFDPSFFDSEDEFLDNYQTPTKTYPKVLLSNFNNPPNYGYFISKVYYSISEGIVAFESREGEYFYRRE